MDYDSMNSFQPFQAATQLNPMAAELILLVRRWAKDRGVSHAAKGHLSPYGWMLLAIFYLQVGKKSPCVEVETSPTQDDVLK
jgi:DNA polymerase sigma